jgi:hypothetical protein
MQERIVSRLYQMKDYALAMREHEDQPSTTRKVRHATLGLCIEVIYIPILEQDGQHE